MGGWLRALGAGAAVVAVTVAVTGSAAASTATLHHRALHRPPDVSGYFGYSVATSGEYAAVGAADFRTTPGPGAVEVYTDASGSWKSMQELRSPTPEPGDGFGALVAISGITLAVREGPQYGAGPVDVFELEAGSWVWTQSLTAAAHHYYDTLSIDGSLMVMGNGGTESGLESYAADVYIWSGSQWTLSTTLARSGKGSFGWSTAIGGSDVMVSAPDANRSSGNVYVYRQVAGAWKLIQTLRDPTTGQRSFFGETLSASGNLLAVDSSDQTTGAAGPWTVYLYRMDHVTSRWHLVATIGVPVSGHYFGAGGLATDGKTVAVGAESDSFGTPGIVYLYAEVAGAWVQTDEIDSPDPAAVFFGERVAVAHRHLLVTGRMTPNGVGVVDTYKGSLIR